MTRFGGFSPDNLSVYACLCDYTSYQDKYRMFARMAELGPRVYMFLLWGEHPRDLKVCANFRQMPPFNCGWKNGRWGALKSLLREHWDPARPSVTHDYVLPEVGLGLRHRWTLTRRPLVRNIVTMVSPVIEYFVTGEWAPRDSVPLMWKEYLYYLVGWTWQYCTVEAGSAYMADGIACNTEGIIRSLRRHLGIRGKPVEFVPDEIDTRLWRPVKGDRAGLGLSEKGPILLFVGNLMRRKGFDIAIRALALVRQKHPNAKLVVRGRLEETKTEWFREVIQETATGDAVIFMGKMPFEKLLTLYCSADMLILPTRHEGSPRVVKEGMACGIPIVTSPISGNRASDPDEEALVIVDTWSPKDYAEAVERVLDDRDFARARGEAGIRVARNKFSLDRVARLNLDFYQKVFAVT